ncbi:MAG TPA: DUF1592 domain-containing protein [Bryobacteraceae bacterium]
MRSTIRLGAIVCAAFAAAAQTAPRLTDTYCAGCHNQKLRTGGVSLEGLDPGQPAGQADTWERVVRMLRSGTMPPPGLPRPDAPSISRFTVSLEDALDRDAAAHPNPGRTAVHRLNRAEYSNAIRDLLAVDIQAGAQLPADDLGYGFDNIADVLSMSPALLDRYLSAARMVARFAVGDLSMKPVEERFAPVKDPPSQFRRVNRIERVSADLPFGSRGGLSFPYYFPLDAEYLIRINLPTGAASFGETIHGDVARFEVRMPVKAGLHTIGATFLRDGAKPEVEAPGARRNNTTGRPAQLDLDPLPVLMDLRMDGALLKRFEVSRRPGQNPDVTAVLITGPFHVTGRGDTAGRERIFVCRPASAKDEEPCAHRILETLARRGFRRPVAEADLKPLIDFYRNGRRGGDFDSGIQAALEAMLVSPDFLFRVECDPRAGDFALASRLSFFLWSSIPDDELLRLAQTGKLQDLEVRRQQVRRMLRDLKSQALIANFGGQWLQWRNLATLKPDPEIFPEFDESLRRSFQQQTELFFESIVREDRSVLDLLSADYTFLNQRLADHYKIPGIFGSQMRRVPVTDVNRAGLLGQGSILAVTSYPNRTSPVQRGKWVLENLIGSPPPPPPTTVPELKDHGEGGRLLTMREQMEQHRNNPACSGCHARMDPIGFALENYDAIGRWREKDAGSPIDASGALPGGAKFEGPAGLTRLLQTTYRDDFVRTVTEKLMTYALGRGLEYYDQPAVRAVMRQAARDDYRMSALIAAIVESVPFQDRRTP